MWIWIVVAFGAAYFILTWSPGWLWKQFNKEICESWEQLKIPQEEVERFDEQALAQIPLKLRRFLEISGYTGDSRMQGMKLQFRDTEFRMKPGGRMKRIEYVQHNYVRRPHRHAFIDMDFLGIAVQGKDTLNDGGGSMTGVLAKCIRLFRSDGQEMARAQLVTCLADAVLMPSLFLEDYCKWEEDEDGLAVTITALGTQAKGRFSFDEEGRIVRFDTGDRMMDDGKSRTPVPWMVEYGNYIKADRYTLPSRLQVSWRLPEGDNVYFIGQGLKVAWYRERSKEEPN